MIPFNVVSKYEIIQSIIHLESCLNHVKLIFFSVIQINPQIWDLAYLLLSTVFIVYSYASVPNNRGEGSQ